MAKIIMLAKLFFMGVFLLPVCLILLLSMERILRIAFVFSLSVILQIYKKQYFIFIFYF